MSEYYKECEVCGATLDPGEQCECEKQELIEVKQLPIIEERLKEIKGDITAKVNYALSLECSEETVKEVKKVRAELNKEFKDYEDKRKAVKNAIMSPYEQFEAVYKDCVSDVFREAFNEIDKKIDDVEDEVKALIEADIRRYFEEYKISKGIDFITFEQAGIKVLKSSSLNKLKEQAKAFVDKIGEDLAVIEMQPCYSDEILYEYKQSLNVSNAITTVIDRHKALGWSEPIPAEPKTQDIEDDLDFLDTTETAIFTVSGSSSQLAKLENYIRKEGIQYERK